MHTYKCKEPGCKVELFSAARLNTVCHCGRVVKVKDWEEDMTPITELSTEAKKYVDRLRDR